MDFISERDDVLVLQSFANLGIPDAAGEAQVTPVFVLDREFGCGRKKLATGIAEAVSVFYHVSMVTRERMVRQNVGSESNLR
jgi:hypothetical protein